MFPAGYFAPTYFDDSYFSASGPPPAVGVGGDLLLGGIG